MNKPAMQLVAELRAKQNNKVKKHYSVMNSKNQEITAIHSKKMELPKESKGSYNPPSKHMKYLFL